MRKSRSKRPQILPLGIKNRSRTELPALVALTAIGESWFSEQHQSDLLAVALVVGVLAAEDSIESRSAVRLQFLCEQDITLDNKYDIAINLAECLPWLQCQPNHRVQQAIEAIAAKRQARAA